MKLGVIVNAGAGTVKRNPRVVDQLRAVVGGDAVHLTRSAEEVMPALAALRERGSEALLVVGGDGTVTGTLTPLLRSCPTDELPAVALVRGGTVNTIARSLGSAAPPLDVARRLLQGSRYEVQRRALVRVRADRGKPFYGMIFVNGVGVRWLQMYHEDSRRGVPGAASVIGRIAGSALVRGELARRAFAPFRAELVVNGKLVPPRDYTVMAAAGIRQIGLGFAPFHSAGRDPKQIHFAVTSASALGILREMPAALAGRHGPLSSLSHFSLGEAEILPETPQAWSLDAETFPAARELEVRASPPIDFLSVRRFG
jgi:diacylglycerol kinase family enzyme